MIVPKNLFVVAISVLIGKSTARTLTNDMYGNLIMDSGGKYPSSTCCVVPTCNTPNDCFQMISCGYLCKTGKYPPADLGPTPGYQLKNSYPRYQCMFGECRLYEMTCDHCQKPDESDFNIRQVREDCKACYQRIQ